MEQTPTPKTERKIPNIMAAVGAVPVVIAVLAFFNINKASDIPIIGNSISQGAQSASVNSDIPESPKSDDTAYYIRLTAPQAGTPEWNGLDIVKDKVFYTEKDRMKWAKLNISGGEHLKDLKLSMTDYDNRSDQDTVRAEDVRDGKEWVLSTSNFKCFVQFQGVNTDTDPDKAQPYPRVITRATLKVRMVER